MIKSENKIETMKNFIIKTAFYILLALFFYVGIKYFLFIILPFGLSFLTSLFLRKIINLIAPKSKSRVKFISNLVAVIFLLLMAIIIIFFGVKIFVNIKSFVLSIPYIYENEILPFFNRLTQSNDTFFSKLNPDMTVFLNEVLKNIQNVFDNFIKELTTSVLFFAKDFVGQIPSFLMSVFLFVISLFLFVNDYSSLSKGILSLFSSSVQKQIILQKNNIQENCFKIMKGYGRIFLITLSQLLVGLLLLKVDNWIVLALYIALTDLLPFVGTGVVLIPWSAICFIQGNNYFGIGILILYCVISVVRSLIEPKIIGNQIGIHPAFMLLLVMVGLKLFGFAGVFVMPLFASVLKSFLSSKRHKDEIVIKKDMTHQYITSKR